MCEQCGMFTLSQYLADTAETQAGLADAAGISRSYLNEITKGLKTPSLSVALRIQAATEGKVDLKTLVCVPSADPTVRAT